MLTIMAFLAKRPDLTTEAFIDHYENHHVPLICRLVGPPPVYRRSYLRRDHAVLPGAAIGFDVVTEQKFADREALDAWLAAVSRPEVAAQVRADEERFLDHRHYFAYVVEEHVTTGT
ncbi:EthD domain-containing protein [Nannocystis punicea]|uniref:EthD domain-containing protein n=1 Tax=Nannocystis punicea TaxID=2995304 RepID=A0ABY7GWG0_9BACT|nr:EthD domain-containing protein [Nannocystis poenicansa]WAS91296.1 EthD domain-containing protein [Nannocystis poenicansa]